MGQWIKCSDMLPVIDYDLPAFERYARVLVNCSAGVLEMNYTSNGYAATEKGRKARWEWNGRIAPWVPTHWMPMPAPPEEA